MIVPVAREASTDDLESRPLRAVIINAYRTETVFNRLRDAANWFLIGYPHWSLRGPGELFVWSPSCNGRRAVAVLWGVSTKARRQMPKRPNKTPEPNRQRHRGGGQKGAYFLRSGPQGATNHGGGEENISRSNGWFGFFKKIYL